MALAPPALSQHGRSSMDILGSIQKVSSGPVRAMAKANFESDPEGKALTETQSYNLSEAEIEARLQVGKAVAQKDPLYRYERFLQRYVAEENFVRGIRAIEEKRDEVEAWFNEELPSVGETLVLNPDLEIPEEQLTEFHLEPGGWDGYDLYGPVIGLAINPRVFAHGGYAAVSVGENIGQQRVDVLKQLPKDKYERIYEPGCGPISTLAVAHSLFPDAELVGCDLSPGLLKAGAQMARRRNIPVTLKQEDCRHTSEPDNHYDAVVTYALHHEMPVEDNRKTFEEMFRIMKPGADIVISDPPPFRGVDPFFGVILDWDTDHREEPWFTVSGLANWEKMLEEIGFENAEGYGLGESGYPWVTRARKPA